MLVPRLILSCTVGKLLLPGMVLVICKAMRKLISLNVRESAIQARTVLKALLSWAHKFQIRHKLEYIMSTVLC